MFRNQKPISADGGVVILIVLIHIIIISSVFAGNPNLSWILMISIILLLLAIYQKRIKNAFRVKFFSGKHHLSKRIPAKELTVSIGNDQCSQPIRLSVLTITSRETILPEAVLPELNENSFYQLHDIDEDEMNTYRLVEGGLVWRINNEYKGCRTVEGGFDTARFKSRVGNAGIKMIELELMPGLKANTDKDGNSAFYDAEGMIHFFGMLREHSDGKPIGLRLSISSKKEFHEICYAIRKTHLIPDFIVVLGQEDEKAGMPLYEALSFVSKTLHIYRLEEQVSIIASSNINSGFDMLRLFALGAKAIYTVAPEPMRIGKYFYGGNTDEISLYQAEDVAQFHKNMLNATVQLMEACGIKNVQDITLSKFFQWLDVLQPVNQDNQDRRIRESGIIKKISPGKIDRKRISMS